MYYFNRYSTILFLFFAMTFYGQVPQDKVKAKIEIEKVEGSVKITGTAENMTDVIRSAAYKLSVIKNNNDNNNQSKNEQVGVFTLQPNEKQKLSTSQINLFDTDEVVIMLLFYDEDKQIIAKDRVVLGEEKKKDEPVKILPDEGFELRGIITDETKTKMGKDFYDRYYYKYNEIGINAKKIVTIGEEYSFARNTAITITIENEVIYDFLVRPDDEFLEAVAEDAVNATFTYLKEKENERKYFTQY